MFRDARQIETGSVLTTPVCIIGGGVAGITLALELMKHGIDSCLLESGGLAPDKSTTDLSTGENIGFPYTFGDKSRSRYLGGSSNCWGGWCAPMLDFDFTKRDWVNHSGWPIDLWDLQPYYERSHAILKLGPYNYDSAHWERVIAQHHVKRVPFVSGKVKDGISQFSPPVRLGSLYGNELKRSKHITTLLYANAMALHTDETGRNIVSLTVKTFTGNSFCVSARMFVLAAGGIENPRLLLSSKQGQQQGLGNEHDLVGRFFMDHPRALSGSIRLNEKWANNRFYDIRYHYHDALVSADSVRVASQLLLTPATMQQERLLHARVSLYSYLSGEGSAGALAANRFKQAVFKKKFEGFRLGKDTLLVLAHPVDVALYGMAWKFRFKSLIKDIKFQIIMEQEPNPASRVMLADEKDGLGAHRIKVNWQLGEAERRTFNRTLEIVANELWAGGVAAQIELHAELQEHEWPQGLTGTWHHMGTTRMHDSPRSGVVDKHCRVHSTTNLFVAGSSVFATSGSNFPTITLTALAIRLSEHLLKELQKHPSVMTAATP